MSLKTGIIEKGYGESETHGNAAAADHLEPEGNESSAEEDHGEQQESKLALSKNQIKKLKKKEKWLQIKAEKRQAEKQKRKRRFAEMRERGENIGPSRKSLKKKRMVDSACRQRVVIDCSFDSYMTEKDTSFLVQQIQHSYAANRRAENPVQLYMCGIGGKAKQRLDSIGDYKGWDLHKEEQDFTDVFSKEDIVYLSSESPNVLHSLDDTKVYVVGGLVDHNHHKGLCHRLAEERGLAHAQLPIGQFLQLQSRKVLTINHVFEILLRFTETQNWETSLLAVLPQRKGIRVKEDNNKSSSNPDTSQNAGKDVSESNNPVSSECKPLVESSSDVSEMEKTPVSEISESNSMFNTVSSSEVVESKKVEEQSDSIKISDTVSSSDASDSKKVLVLESSESDRVFDTEREVGQMTSVNGEKCDNGCVNENNRTDTCFVTSTADGDDVGKEIDNA